MNRKAKGRTPIVLLILLSAVPHSGKEIPSNRLSSSRPTFPSVRNTPEVGGSVRAELVRMQVQDGLTIAWYDHNGPAIVNFDKLSIIQGKRLVGQSPGQGIISRDGTQIALQLGRPTKDPPLILGIMNANNSDLREFPNVARPGLMCWSYDMAHIALATASKGSSTVNLEVLDLESKSVRNIALADRITSQCWSPDGKEIVFESGGKVMIQDVEATRPRELVVGVAPTWSPDGKWIAYLDKHEHSYYVIHPSGEGKKKLFHKRNGMAGLYWSPDARIVAYVIEEGGLFSLDAEAYRLEVRRLEDNLEDWVADGVDCCASIQWVTSKDLLRQVESQAAAK